VSDGPSPQSTPPATGLARAWPLVALAGLAVGYLVLEEPEKINPGTRAALSAVGATLLLARAYAARGRQMAATVLTLVLVAWAALVVGSTTGPDLGQLFRGETRLWSNYHYYLGAKYFSEMGYTGLYDQTVAVDVEQDQRFAEFRWIRDLDSYGREPTNYNNRIRSEGWTQARWEQFTDDVLWFQARVSDRRWRRILHDRGYNATPTSNTLYWLLSRVHLSEQNLALISALDPLLLLFAFVVAGLVFGPVRSLVSAAWLLLFFGSLDFIVGGTLLYDYLAALILMACAVHRNRPMTAGVLFGYACMTRVFPSLLLAGLIVWTIIAVRREGSFPRFTSRFGRGLLGAVAVLAVIGCLNGRGVSAWTDWTDQIATHTENHRFGDRRIGLQHVFTHDWSLDRGDWRKQEWRRRTWPRQKGRWVAGAALLFGLWLLAAWRGTRGERDPLDSIVFGLALVFAGIVLSRYYWGVACLFFLLGGRERDGPREAWIGAGLLGLVAVYYAGIEGMDSRFGAYVLVNLTLLVWFVAALIARTVWRVEADSTVVDVAPHD
jgi:hypothetical protein